MGIEIANVGDYIVTLHALCVFIVALFVEICGWFVFMRERNQDESVYFLILTNTLFIWLLSSSLTATAPTREIALDWIKFGYLGIPFIAPALYQFTVCVLGCQEQRREYIACQWTLGAVFASTILVFDAFVAGVYRYEWGFFPRLNNESFVFSAAIAIGIGGSLFEYTRALGRSQSDADEQRTLWLLSALSIASFGLIDFIPAYGIDVYPIGYVSLGLFAVAAGYTIWRYRLVELTPSFVAGRVFDAMEDPLLVCDEKGHIRIANEAVHSVLGYDTSELSDEFIGHLVVESPSSVSEDLHNFIHRPVRGREMLWRAADGSEVAVELSVRVLSDDEDNHIGTVIIARDLRDQRRTQAQLESSRERFELIAKGANDGIWDWDLETDELFYSKRWKRAIGYEDEAIEERPEEWFERIHPDDRPRVRSTMSAHLEGGAPTFECEYRLEHRDGSYCWMEARGLAVRDEDDRPLRMVGTQIDISERKELEEQLRREYLHDTLTDLPNRELFLDRIDRLLELRDDQLEHDFSVCVLDIDRFTVINDRLGHEVGDDLLVRTAERLESMLDEADTVARLGSDEFGLLLADASDRDEALWVADRIAQQLNYPIWVDDEQIDLSVSIGVAVSSREYGEAEELLRDADLAMYDAKSEDRDDIVGFDTEMKQRVIGRARLESELEEAIEAERLSIHYQPIVDLESGEIQSYEALTRWNHPEYGSVSPGRFIPIAEQSGLIVDLTQYVLNRVTQQLAEWAAYLPSMLAPVQVNVSSVEVTQSELTQTLADRLSSTEFPENMLCMELTERAVFDHPEGASHIVERLQSMGITVAIDDFGTGYSSLSYLRQFDADQIKIDREFIRDVASNSESREIVRTVSRLADTLGMKVVAEGIERTCELEALRSFDIACGQGYYWSKPLPPDELTDIEETTHEQSPAPRSASAG